MISHSLVLAETLAVFLNVVDSQTGEFLVLCSTTSHKAYRLFLTHLHVCHALRLFLPSFAFCPPGGV